MQSRPILFSAPMVRAILDGSKTQTRRIMRHQPNEEWSPAHYAELHGYDKDGCLTPEKVIGWGVVNDDGEYGYKFPYGEPGDQLWVRETHYIIEEGQQYFYKATGGYSQYKEFDESNGDQPLVWTGPWKPAIHMPRRACRITLEITRARVERLHACNEVDAIAEGAPWSACGSPQEGSHKAGFAQLWESINGPGSWDANPWVWVVEFKRINP